MNRSPITRKTPMKRTGIKSARATPGPVGILWVPSMQRKAKAEPKRRTRKCAVKTCRQPFEPRSMTHRACSPDCAVALAAADRVSADRRATRARLSELKTRSQHIKLAQSAFNAYIRARDADQPCICCGAPLPGPRAGGGFDAGHYRSVGSAPHLRFNEANCHGQTKQCNRYGAGRAVDYRIGLIARIGIEAVESLEADQVPRKYTIDELKAITAHYRDKTKELAENKKSM